MISLTGVGTPTGMLSASTYIPSNSTFNGHVKVTLGLGSAP
jgi:hypothetical protein